MRRMCGPCLRPPGCRRSPPPAAASLHQPLGGAPAPGLRGRGRGRCPPTTRRRCQRMERTGVTAVLLQSFSASPSCDKASRTVTRAAASGLSSPSGGIVSPGPTTAVAAPLPLTPGALRSSRRLPGPRNCECLVRRLGSQAPGRAQRGLAHKSAALLSSFLQTLLCPGNRERYSAGFNDDRLPVHPALEVLVDPGQIVLRDTPLGLNRSQRARW